MDWALLLALPNRYNKGLALKKHPHSSCCSRALQPGNLVCYTSWLHSGYEYPSTFQASMNAHTSSHASTSLSVWVPHSTRHLHPGLLWRRDYLTASTSTPQLPFKETQIPFNRDHRALNRGTLGGLGRETHRNDSAASADFRIILWQHRQNQNSKGSLELRKTNAWLVPGLKRGHSYTSLDGSSYEPDSAKAGRM